MAKFEITQVEIQKNIGNVAKFEITQVEIQIKIGNVAKLDSVL